MGARLNDRDDDPSALTDINITPFIDVMLVLLIIFMVAAPLSTVDVPVDLPKVSATPTAREAEPVIVTLTADGRINLSGSDIPRGALAAAVGAATDGDRDTRLYLSADQAVPYGDLMAVMEEVRRAGYGRIALVGLEGTAP